MNANPTPSGPANAGAASNNESVTVRTTTISLRTGGNCDMVDITDRVRAFLRECGMREGTLTVFAIGSTTGISTIEYEPGLVRDVPEMLDKIAPPGNYHHDQTWHDGNGHSHLRSFLVGTSFAVPFVDGQLRLGTWQQIVFVDFDNRPRQREIVLQCIGCIASAHRGAT